MPRENHTPPAALIGLTLLATLALYYALPALYSDNRAARRAAHARAVAAAHERGRIRLAELEKQRIGFERSRVELQAACEGVAAVDAATKHLNTYLAELMREVAGGSRH